MTLFPVVGVRIIPTLWNGLLEPREKLRVDVGTSEHPRWIHGFDLACIDHSPLILPRNVYGIARGLPAAELVLELRKLADAIERHL
jgi:hypothetical protein